jgi:hypothetical protein
MTMTLPRPLPRDRPHCAHVRHPPFPEERARNKTIAGAADDPDRLIEDAFMGRPLGYDPVSAVLAWIFCSASKAHIPVAASRLAIRFRRQAKVLSKQQRQVISLLDFIAAHQRVPSAEAPETKFHNDNDKGSS